MTRIIKYGQQDNEIRNLLQDYKQKSNQHKNNKFSMSFSDCSAVLENGSRRNSNLCDTNEVSWLEKLSENDNRNKSKWASNPNDQTKPFYQSKYLLFDTNEKYQIPSNRNSKNDPKNQINSSIVKSKLPNNKNQIEQTYRRQATKGRTVLKDIQNTESVRRANSTAQKKKVIGSIKRNRVDSHIQNKILHQQFFQTDVDLEELQKVRMSKLQEMNEKLNKVLHISSSKAKNEYQPAKQPNSQILERRISKQQVGVFPNKPIKNQNYQLSSRSITRSHSQALSAHVKSQKLKEKPCLDNVACLEIMFDILDSKNQSILSKSNCNVEEISQEFKFIFGCIFTRIFLKQLTCTKRQFVKLCQKIIKQLDSDEIVDLLRLFTDRYLSNHQTIKGKDIAYNKSNRPIAMQGSISKTSQSSLLEKKQPLDQLTDSVQINKQHAFRPGKQIVQRQYFNKQSQQKLLTNVKAHKVDDFQSTLKIGRNLQNSNNQHFTLNKIDISESMIQQHKQNLKQISELDKMVENCLTSKINYRSFGIEHQDQSLRFDQLVKHI